MSHFVFCHGFGFDQSFWTNLAPYFSEHKCTFLDLGYFNKQSLICEHNSKELIGIGHSLGFMKLLELNLPFKYLIGINSFTNFLGFEPLLRSKRQVELQLLQRSFTKNPIVTLQAFYKRCGLKPLETVKEADLNLQSLQHDLQLLHDLPSRHRLTHSPLIPTLIISADADVIVPRQIINDNFLHLANVTIEHAAFWQHALGAVEAAYIHTTITRFLDAQPLNKKPA